MQYRENIFRFFLFAKTQFQQNCLFQSSFRLPSYEIIRIEVRMFLHENWMFEKFRCQSVEARAQWWIQYLVFVMWFEASAIHSRSNFAAPKVLCLPIGATTQQKLSWFPIAHSTLFLFFSLSDHISISKALAYLIKLELRFHLNMGFSKKIVQRPRHCDIHCKWFVVDSPLKFRNQQHNNKESIYIYTILVTSFLSNEFIKKFHTWA